MTKRTGLASAHTAVATSQTRAWQDRWTGKTIDDALMAAVERYGDREAYVFGTERQTFRQVADGAERVARAFLRLGLQAGDRVAIWMAGYPEWAHLYFGLVKIGVVMVPINTRYRPSEMAYVLERSGCRALVFRDETVGGKDYRSLLLELCPELQDAQPDEFHSARLPELRSVIAVNTRGTGGIIDYAEFLARGDALVADELDAAVRAVTPEHMAIIQFTSGTTAFPKGAELFQSAILRGAAYSSDTMLLGETDRFFSPQPFYHVGGSIQVILAPVVCGLVAVVQPYFDAAGALDLMESERCTGTMGHQPHYIEYMNDPRLSERKLRIQRASIFAPPEVNVRVARVLGIPWLVSPYGMTETHLGGTGCRPDANEEQRLTTVGAPMPGVELLIRDPMSGQPAEPGEAGEVCFRGWCLMRGYHHEPERTAEVIDQEGWFHTGDVGVLDSDGYLRLAGRLKDMIRVGGENLAAAEVEAVLMDHSAVKQAVALGRPDARLGEVVFAFIELKANMAVTEGELIGHCRARLASFKVPREVRFIDEWPMSGTGKIHKIALKERLLAETAGGARAH